MSLIRRQLRTANAQIDACEIFASSIHDAGSESLRLGWIKEDIVEARSSLKKINIEIVDAFRRQGKATDDVLDQYVREAEKAFRSDVRGVLVCIDELNTRFGAKNDSDAVLKLEKLRKQARKVVRTLYLATRPKLAFLLSWRCLLLIIVAGLIAASLLYVTHYATHPKDGLTGAQTIKYKAADDTKKISEVARAPDASFIDRSLNTATTIVDLLPKIPKAILAVTAAIAAFQGLLAKFFKPKPAQNT